MSMFDEIDFEFAEKRDFYAYFPTDELAEKAWEWFLSGVGFGDDTPQEMVDAWQADGEALEKEKIKTDYGLAAEEQGLTVLDFLLGIKPDMDKYYKIEKGGDTNGSKENNS